MSKIANKPIAVPKGVTVKFAAGTVTVTGPKGTLTRAVPATLGIEQKDAVTAVPRLVRNRETAITQGTLRAHIVNMVKGVSEGFSRSLILEGVGFRAQSGKDGLNLSLGFSHPVTFRAPAGLKLDAAEQPDKTTRVTVSGADLEQVGQAAAELRRLKPPEPYKGKGFRYADERIRRKAGKAVAK